MVKKSKRVRAIEEKITLGKAYAIDEAFDTLKKISTVKFKETIEVNINLGINPRKSDQVVRGATVLPNGTGRDVRVAVFTQGDNVNIAKEAGADVVGLQDLADEVKTGKLDFDVVIATPDSMAVVGQLGQILGPRGLMPNPKVGTVSKDVATAVKNAKAGQVRYRTDKNGIIHCGIGKVDFSIEQLRQNLAALLTDLHKAKPATAKGVYFKKISLSSTMGPGLAVDQASLGS